MKVALINPGRDSRYAIQEPLNLGFIAGYLEKHSIETRIIDELAREDVDRELRNFKPDFAGITAATPLAPDAYRVAALCRKLGITTVMGGVHASVCTDEALSHVDRVVKGEGEQALLDIVQGTAGSDRVVSRPFIKNLDEVPMPARHLLRMDYYMRSKDRMPASYLHFVPPGTRVAAMITSRGCPYACTFCHNTWRGAPYRFNGINAVMEDLRLLVDRYGVKAVFFIEDNFFVNRARVESFCIELRKNKLDIIWGANARVDNVDERILKIVKDAGCRQITFGFESGSQRILDILKKNTKVEQNRKAIELCKEAGIISQGTFMVGNPTETVEDIRLTQEFIRANPIGSCGVCLTTPYPGTELWDWCEKRGKIPGSLDWKSFDYHQAVITVCDTIEPSQLRKLFEETVGIASRKSRITVRQLITALVLRPGQVFQWLAAVVRRPSLLIDVLKKLRVR